MNSFLRSVPAAWGRVYRARDSRLGRDVAIKILPAELCARVVGFAEYLNLLAIHDVGNEQGLKYLVAEFLGRKTLRERLNEGALPQRKVVDDSTKIANGPAAAHISTGVDGPEREGAVAIGGTRSDREPDVLGSSILKFHRIRSPKKISTAKPTGNAWMKTSYLYETADGPFVSGTFGG